MSGKKNKTQNHTYDMQPQPPNKHKTRKSD